MSRIKRTSVHLAGWSLFGVIFYAVAIATLQIIAMVALNSKQIIKTNPIYFFQRNYYNSGLIHIWQEDPACAQADRELIYKPRNGSCHFANPEFDTTLNFDDLGRAVPDRHLSTQSGNGIAVLGDSYAMGWGVNDDETFANVLQQGTAKPVYNLGVSSYGTERELKRLVISGVIDKVDTIVIQYCDNDMGENAADLNEEHYLEMAVFFEQKLQADRDHGLRARLKYIYQLLRDDIKESPGELARLLRGPYTPDFSPHQRYLRATLQRYESYLHDKRVVIFYATDARTKFFNFPEGQDSQLPWVSYFDPGLTKADYFVIDDHVNARGHRRIGEYLAALLHSD